jgi:cell division protein ZapA
MNIITVKINGVEYNLKGEEKEEYLHKVASYVDRKMKSLLNNNLKLSTTSAAVLTAVNAVDDLFKCDMANGEVSSKVKILQDNETILIQQLEDLKNQVASLENSNNELQKKLSHSVNESLLKEKDETIIRLSEELSISQHTCKKYIDDNSILKEKNKDLKFQIQTAKYKIMELQNKLIESQIDIAKMKKASNPLLKTEK